MGVFKIDGTSIPANTGNRYDVGNFLYTNPNTYGLVGGFYNKKLRISYVGNSSNGYSPFDTIVASRL